MPPTHPEAVRRFLNTPVMSRDGTVFAISEWNLRIALRRAWPRVTAPYYRVYWSVMKAHGVDPEEGLREIRKIRDYRNEFGLIYSEIFGAYGLEKGIYREDGTFVACGGFESYEWQRQLMDASRARFAGPITEERWPGICAEAHAAAQHRHSDADIDVECSWVRSRLYEWPDFENAPSRGAIKLWMAVMQPGNDDILKRFVLTDLQRRLRNKTMKDRAELAKLPNDRAEKLVQDTCGDGVETDQDEEQRAYMLELLGVGAESDG